MDRNDISFVKMFSGAFFPLQNIAVVDPGIPGWGGGVKPWALEKDLIFGKIFSENCMEMKEIG